MSTAKPRKRWTVQGKIIYERETHYFDIKDIRRIQEKVKRRFAEESTGATLARQIYDFLAKMLEDLINDILREIQLSGLIKAKEVRLFLQNIVEQIMSALGIDYQTIDADIEKAINSLPVVMEEENGG